MNSRRVFVCAMGCLLALGLLNRTFTFFEFLRQPNVEQQRIDFKKDLEEAKIKAEKLLKDIKQEHIRQEELTQELQKKEKIKEFKKVSENIESLQKQKQDLESNVKDIEQLYKDLSETKEMDEARLKEISKKIPIINKNLKAVEQETQEIITDIKKALELPKLTAPLEKKLTLNIIKISPEAKQKFEDLVSQEEPIFIKREKMKKFHKLLVMALVFVGLARMRLGEFFQTIGKHSKMLKTIGNILSKSLDMYAELLMLTEAGLEPYKEEVDKERTPGQSREEKFNEEIAVLNENYQRVMNQVNKLKDIPSLIELEHTDPELYEAAAAYLPSTLSLKSLQELDKPVEDAPNTL